MSRSTEPLHWPLALLLSLIPLVELLLFRRAGLSLAAPDPGRILLSSVLLLSWSSMTVMRAHIQGSTSLLATHFATVHPESKHLTGDPWPAVRFRTLPGCGPWRGPTAGA